MARFNSRDLPPGGRSTFLVLTLLVTACASGGGAGAGSPDVITRDQFDPSAQTALDIVQRLRPSWLRARSQGTITNPEPAYATVMLDELRLGDISSLEGIRSDQIDRIEFMSAIDATTRYGTGFVGGVITVRTVAGSR